MTAQAFLASLTDAFLKSSSTFRASSSIYWSTLRRANMRVAFWIHVWKIESDRLSIFKEATVLSILLENPISTHQICIDTSIPGQVQVKLAAGSRKSVWLLGTGNQLSPSRQSAPYNIFADSITTSGGNDHFERFWYLKDYGRQHAPWYAALLEPQQNVKRNVCLHRMLGTQWSGQDGALVQSSLSTKTATSSWKSPRNATFTTTMLHPVRLPRQPVARKRKLSLLSRPDEQWVLQTEEIYLPQNANYDKKRPYGLCSY